MKIKFLIIPGILVIGISLIFIYGNIFSSNDKYKEKEIKSTVSVSLKPVEVTGTTVKFSLSLNTHSVPLEGIDLKKSITLKTDSGEIHPVSVPDLSSHHGSGTIVFNLKSPIKTITVFVSGVPDLEKRTFKWDI